MPRSSDIAHRSLDATVSFINKWSTLTKRPHRRRTWTVQSCSPVPSPVRSNTCFLGPTRVRIPNGISIGSVVFAQLTAERSYTLQRATTSHPSQNYLFTWGIWTPSNTSFIGPTQVHNQTSRSIQPFLQDSRQWQTDRQTGRQRDHAIPSVTIGRIYTYVVLRCGLKVSPQWQRKRYPRRRPFRSFPVISRCRWPRQMIGSLWLPIRV